MGTSTCDWAGARLFIHRFIPSIEIRFCCSVCKRRTNTCSLVSSIRHDGSASQVPSHTHICAHIRNECEINVPWCGQPFSMCMLRPIRPQINFFHWKRCRTWKFLIRVHTHLLTFADNGTCWRLIYYFFFYFLETNKTENSNRKLNVTLCVSCRPNYLLVALRIIIGSRFRRNKFISSMAIQPVYIVWSIKRSKWKSKCLKLHSAHHRFYRKNHFIRIINTGFVVKCRALKIDKSNCSMLITHIVGCDGCEKFRFRWILCFIIELLASALACMHRPHLPSIFV